MLLALIDRIAIPRATDRHIEWTRAAHARMDAAVPDGAVVFLGDSITQCLVTAAVAPLAVNFGVCSQRSDQLLASMDNYRCMKRASAVSILIGTNDIMECKAEGLEERYAQILFKVPEGVPVVFSSIPPIARPGLDQQARAASLSARAVCEGRRNCTFLDLHSALDGVPGALTADGVHLDVPGYQVWVRMLRQVLATSP